MSENHLDPSRTLVLSLKPRFAEAILSGRKTVELRRVMPRITVPTLALLYASGPTRSLVGTCVVSSVVRYQNRELWRLYGAETALSRSEFDAYLTGREAGVALLLEQVNRLPAPIPLPALRRAAAFRPPQSIAYVGNERRERLLTATS